MVVQFNNFVPVIWVDVAAAVTLLIIAVGVVYKLRNWMRVVPKGFFHDARRELKTGGMVGMFFSELATRVVAQKGIINDSRMRLATHLLVFWGFIGLAFATVWDDLFFRDGALPPPLTSANFGNLVGNVGGALLLVGATVIIVRYLVSDVYRKSWKGDLVFLTFLYLTTISGFTTEFTRFSSDPFADTNYLIHLGLIGALFISAPFTHFFHAILTPVMRYVERTEKTLNLRLPGRANSYRREAMVGLAEDVRSKNVEPTYPEWLRKKDKSSETTKE